MKVIVSHDVDHITVREHHADLIVPKFIVRNLIEFILGYITAPELKYRFIELTSNKWQYLKELMEFDKSNKIQSQYFIAVSKGTGLSYSLQNAAVWVKKIKDMGFDVGVHGIAYNSYVDIEREYNLFKEISGNDTFGIRIHYIKMSNETVYLLNRAGYLFDSSLYADKNPYRKERIWEFPLHIMDSYLLRGNKKWQSRKLEELKDITVREIDNLSNKGIKYLTILFHDRYFNDGFLTCKNWYIWIIGYLKEKGFEFVNYAEAIKDLEKRQY